MSKKILFLEWKSYGNEYIIPADSHEAECLKRLGVKNIYYLPLPSALSAYDHMQYAMKCAKINLNITLRSIHTGIPLRAMDILGAGGFLVTNYQADFMEHFAAGEDFVYYDLIEQIPELIEYYLAHENERQDIAHNGYEKVKNNFTYEKML